MIIDPEDFMSNGQIDTEDLIPTLIHEYGHLLSITEEQIEYTSIRAAEITDEEFFELESNCPTFFIPEGCLTYNSYLNIFYDMFWGDKHDELLQIESIENDEEYEDALYTFYEKYSDEFVTEYAATNPDEDWAESWVIFVLEEKPYDDSIASEKLLYFYDFPELVELREHVRNHISIES